MAAGLSDAGAGVVDAAIVVVVGTAGVAVTGIEVAGMPLEGTGGATAEFATQRTCHGEKERRSGQFSVLIREPNEYLANIDVRAFAVDVRVVAPQNRRINAERSLDRVADVTRLHDIGVSYS